MKPKQLTSDENQKLSSFICPDCGTPDLIILGPRGGLSRNCVCGACKTEFNRSEILSERIGQPCDIHRQGELYQLDRYPVENFHMKTPIGKSELEKLGCSNPDCKDPNCDEINIRSQCHNWTPLISAAFNKREGVFYFFCGECRRPIVKVQLVESRFRRFRYERD